jgi:hypothetical protein
MGKKGTEIAPKSRFLELVMGIPCSIVYENEPIEKNTMNQKPRNLPILSHFKSNKK